MHHWTKCLFALAAPLLLTGCLWGPGKFVSDLTVRKDGSFTLDYRGQIVLQLPPEDPSKPEFARCYEGIQNKPGSIADVTPPGQASPKERACTKEEIAAQKADLEGRSAKGRQDAKQMAEMFGLPGVDDESNRAFAAKLSKYAGYRSVTYRGKGVFDVDYHFDGRATQDFVFPAFPDNNLIVPFVALRRRADGSVLVTAPSFTGGAGPMGGALAGAGDMKGQGPRSRAEGRFTVITDGEILTNNSEDGAATDPIGHRVHWDVGPASNKIPEMLIRL